MAKVMIVDDNQYICRLLRLTLARSGHETMTAENGAVALELAKTNPPDILITDLFMPIADGVDTILAFKRENASIGVIAITGEGRFPAETSTLLAHMRELGAKYAFAKPFNIHELADAVNALAKEIAALAQQENPAASR